MGPAGAGSLAQVINAALASKGRFDTMKEFFGAVGEGASAGVWHDRTTVPVDRPEFRSYYKRQLEKAAKKRKSEEMI
jgi:chlorophyllide a reductase subunit Y